MKRERVFLLSVLALLAAVTFASCKNRQAEVPEAAKVISGLEKMTSEITISGIADRIWDFSQTRPNGFTLNLRTITEPTEGIAVSYAIPRNCNSRDELDKVVIHALLHDGYIGGWFDSEDSPTILIVRSYFLRMSWMKRLSLGRKTASTLFIFSLPAHMFV